MTLTSGVATPRGVFGAIFGGSLAGKVVGVSVVLALRKHLNILFFFFIYLEAGPGVEPRYTDLQSAA